MNNDDSVEDASVESLDVMRERLLSLNLLFDAASAGEAGRQIARQLDVTLTADQLEAITAQRRPDDEIEH